MSTSPESIARLLDEDLNRSVEAVEREAERAREQMRTTGSRRFQMRARRSLEALEALARDLYFGFVRVREEGEERIYRFGAANCPKARILSWKHPMAYLYYEVEPGEDYDRSAGGREIEGELEVRAQLELNRRERCLRGATWCEADQVIDVTAQHFGQEEEVEEELEHGLREIIAWITPEQYRLIASESQAPLIIQGRAGSGKTTVALHRVSWLMERAELEPEAVLIVMFNKALQGFVEHSLAPLGLSRARIATFHSWALETLQRVYKGRLIIRTGSLPGAVTARRLKAHVGLLDAIERYVADQTWRMEQWLCEQLEASDYDRFMDLEGAPVERLYAMRDVLDEERTRRDAVRTIITRAIRKMTLYKEDLHAVLTDVALLRAHLSGVRTRDLQTLRRYQERHQGEGAAATQRLGHHVDFDDLALLLRIIQVKRGGLPLRDPEAVTRFDHLVVDEAQDFGAVPLRVLFDAVHSRSGVTIVGDLNQKILPSADFIGWEGIAAELGLSGSAVTRLTVSHRSSRPIVNLSEALLGEPLSEDGRPGPTPEDHHVSSAREADAVLMALILERSAEAPSAHICVVCDTPQTARDLHARISARLGEAGAPAPRLGRRGDFRFEAGVTVTNVHQVKGLEFDTVLLYEPTPEAFPDSEQGQRDLYVAVTRAEARLDVVGHSERSPLLEAIPDTLLTRRRAGAAANTDQSPDDVPF